MTADLHVHTTASDGTLTPSQLVELAKNIGLKAVGITDHDTLLGIEEARCAGEKLGVEIVPGIELNTDLAGTEVHILGYYLELASPELNSALTVLREARSSRVGLIIQKLNEIGLDITEARVRQIAGQGAIGRPHIAQALEEKGYVSNVKEAFDRYIGNNGPAYVSRYKLTPEEGIQLICRAQGIAVLAHPGLVGKDEIIPALVAVGLAGLEVIHSQHSPEQERHYTKLALENGLLTTGGSDYHGPGRKLGVELGGRKVPLEVVAKLKGRKEEMA